MLLWCSQLPNSDLPRMKRSVTWLNPHNVLPALLCLSDKHPSFNVALISQVRLSSANVRAALRCHCERRVLCTHVPGACSPERITEWGKIIFAVATEWGGTQCACSIAAEVTYELLLEIIKKYPFFSPLSVAPSLLDRFLAEQDLRPSSTAYLLASPCFWLFSTQHRTLSCFLIPDNRFEPSLGLTVGSPVTQIRHRHEGSFDCISVPYLTRPVLLPRLTAKNP